VRRAAHADALKRGGKGDVHCAHADARKKGAENREIIKGVRMKIVVAWDMRGVDKVIGGESGGFVPKRSFKHH
jgi:hypothetical protein